MKDFEWILSICIVCWILILARVVSAVLGYTTIIVILTVYYLVKNGYFGD